MTNQAKPTINHFTTIVAGVTKDNYDKSSRQKIIRTHCVIGEEVLLIPEPFNKFDPDAIKVCLQNGFQIGYLPSEISSKIVRKQLLKQSANYAAFLRRVGPFKNDEDETVWFVELIIVEWNNSFDANEAREYFENLRTKYVSVPELEFQAIENSITYQRHKPSTGCLLMACVMLLGSYLCFVA